MTTPQKQRTEAVAQALLDRFQERIAARGGVMPCAAKINECVPSYRDDFMADAAAAIRAYDLETIVAAAIKYNDLILVVEKPRRHPDVFRELDALNWTEQRHTHVQGFITSTGRFVERKEARQIAEAADQIIEGQIDKDGVPYKFQHSDLFSEDVW